MTAKGASMGFADKADGDSKLAITKTSKKSSQARKVAAAKSKSKKVVKKSQNMKNSLTSKQYIERIAALRASLIILANNSEGKACQFALKALSNDEEAAQSGTIPDILEVHTFWTQDQITQTVNAVWDQKDMAAAENCAQGTNAPKAPNEDCNCFVKNACRPLFSSSQIFDSTVMGANDIIENITNNNGWKEIENPGNDGTQRTADAIAIAQTGAVVIAGMTSEELEDDNGHLAILVTGTEQAGAAHLTVPKCTAGALHSNGRKKNKGVNWTFGASKVRMIRYFYRFPDASQLSIK